jgi:hypothetical protein
MAARGAEEVDRAAGWAVGPPEGAIGPLGGPI